MVPALRILSYDCPRLASAFLLSGTASAVFAQAGLVTTPSTVALLDPNGDGYITASGAPFTSGTTELAELGVLPGGVTDWVPIFDLTEAGSDVTPSCSFSDLATDADADGGDFAFWNITDPTPGTPTSGDEHMVLRVRTADAAGGTVGLNVIFSTDGRYGDGRSRRGGRS